MSDSTEEDRLWGENPQYGSVLVSPLEATSGESFDKVPRARRQLGLASATFLIFNRVIGTGIFATPSVILLSSGSVGIALLMWVLGAVIAIAGTTVYVELGTGLPRSGGEKNYLEYIYRRPKFMASCIYGVYTLIGGSNAPNALVFGEYTLNALALPLTPFNTRLTALLVLTFSLLMIGVLSKSGIRLINTLGTFKFGILVGIAALGLLSLAGVPGLGVRPEYEQPRNFASWEAFWGGSRRDANSLVTALYNVIWSFIGYSNANYALSEVKDPVRTIKRAAPFAILSVAAVYMLVNIAYFGVVSKADILGSRQIVAALFFRNLFGPATERALSACIALSSLGNILSVLFTQGRVIQELAREGILPSPLNTFFATNKPFGAPLAGLTVLYFISVVLVVAPPPGDAYTFLLSVSSYALTLINTLVSFGLLLLHTPAYRPWAWDPPFRAPRAVAHVLFALAASQLGVLYWAVWVVWLPRRGGYALKREWRVQEDGVSRFVFVRVPKAAGTEAE
ncbi:High affinity methionine permease [Mycena sanguinolenta]|uniref:High affinity methionine permease n=1 Tax=Mycena sanguinolenta TaxID=230812 RepID=A0A8H6XP85_9AGAR|nr:High affinity methionine permease [Mycena sanguinolenta]